MPSGKRGSLSSHSRIMPMRSLAFTPSRTSALMSKKRWPSTRLISPSLGEGERVTKFESGISPLEVRMRMSSRVEMTRSSAG